MSDRTISFLEIYSRVLHGWKSVALTTAACALFSILLCMIVPHAYTVELLVKPIDQNLANDSTNTGAVSSTLSALSSLSGQGAMGPTDFQRYQQLISSAPVAEILAKDPTIMHGVFRSFWDSRAKQWKPGGLKYYLFGWLYALAGLPAWQAPNAYDLSTYIGGHVITDASLTSDVLSLTYETPDPAFGIKFLAAIHNATDSILRVEANKQATLVRSYLENALGATQIESSREALIQLLMQQEQKIILTQNGVAYAAQAIGGPDYSQIATSPKPIRFLLVGILAGFILGILGAISTEDRIWIFVRHAAWKRDVATSRYNA
jgi:hypothetical protein